MERKQKIEFMENYNFELEYYLIEERCDETDADPFYGIQIIKKGKEKIEEECTNGLTYSKKFALELLTKLSSSSVTPIVMLEVVDELMSEIVC